MVVNKEEEYEYDIHFRISAAGNPDLQPKQELPEFVRDWLTIRLLNKNQKNLSEQKLMELDEKLLGI